jgi:hypothetical protein
MTKQETEPPQVIGVGHVALSARDSAALAEFDRDVLSPYRSWRRGEY